MKKHWIWIIIGVVVALIITLIILNRKSDSVETPKGTNTTQSPSTTISSAVQAGKLLSNNKCTGEGAGVLTQLPMKQSDYAMILPYGLMVGGHVTPIDHQYFSPTVFNSPRDTYPVYAMADSVITDIQPRTNDRGTEYRFVFTMSCTFFYYYDLVTSLAPDIKAAYEKKNLNYKVKAGQLVGRIGGQTLDFAVWDTTKPLKNFINPSSYSGEAWKIYTADPLDYYSSEVKKNALAKYIRTIKPVSGRIDYDIDGKIIGNWFIKDSDGYTGTGENQNEYWGGHLAIAPEYIDNSATIISFGSWNSGDAKQFAVKNPLDPAKIGVADGIVRYEIYGYYFVKKDGSRWDNMTHTFDPKLKISNQEFGGCVLLQLIETRKLKVEQFPKKKCTEKLVFTSASKIYTR
ncbi:hypothetical protein HY844_02010 [Candidatus Berkelbacteria bacterium]|nr:hypothetical protein [Candidatus Berkelbacteria bacterium]